jgi:hypothetical protein
VYGTTHSKALQSKSMLLAPFKIKKLLLMAGFITFVCLGGKSYKYVEMKYVPGIKNF